MLKTFFLLTILFWFLQDCAQAQAWPEGTAGEAGIWIEDNNPLYVDQEQAFAGTIDTVFPERYYGQAAWLVVEFRIKNPKQGGGGLVISLMHKGNVRYWKLFDFHQYHQTEELWYTARDSVLIPQNIIHEGSLKSYLWSGGKSETFEMHGLRLWLKPYYFSSVVPHAFKLKDDLLPARHIMHTDHHICEISKEDFRVLSLENLPLINTQVAYIQYLHKGDTLEDWLQIKWKKSSTEGVFLGTSKASIGKLNLEVQLHNSLPEIYIHWSFRPKKETQLLQLSIAHKLYVEVKEIYTHNRLADTNLFYPEYWIDKQGLKAGQGSSTLYYLPGQGISSASYQTIQNTLWIHLDCHKDHPYLYFPLLDSARNYYENYSSTQLKKRQALSGYYRFSAGLDVGSWPRMMRQPYGYRAAFIWTEHADFTDMSANRAVYFGHDSIHTAAMATGGFNFYRVPVTKSIFYDNPDLVMNPVFDNINMQLTEELSWKRSKVYRDFIDDLYKTGHEICLHTPDHYTSSRDLLEESLDEIGQRYHSAVWIDHGYDNGAVNNREDFVCDGLNPDAPCFSADLWAEYGITYFWNAFDEDHSPYYGYEFGNSVLKPYPGFAHALHQPLYWKHPSRTGDFYSWTTRSVHYISDEGLWNYYFAEDNLADLVDFQEVFIAHVYPASVKPGIGYWKFDGQDRRMAQPGFNEMLQRLDAFRNKGELWLTTMGSFMDYQVQISNVEIEVLEHGLLSIINQNDRQIKGFSLACKAGQIISFGKPLQVRKEGHDCIVTMNIDAGEQVLLMISE